ncbi:MAG: AMP-binding protein, partial [Burkholderiales bacterium]
MNDFSPLLDRHRPQDAVAFQSQHMISAAQFLNEVTQLAARLPRKRYMLNLCEDRYNFLVSFAAALQVRQVSLLPPSHASNTLRQLCADYPDAYCLADHAEVPDALTLMAFPNDLQRSAGACAIPDIPGKQTAAIVFTSGSTGRPTPHVKNWASLTAIARAVGKRIALAPGAGIIGTIPPQHLYGLETTIMLPLQWGCGLHHARPLLPADIQFALGQMPRPCWLMTTPLHLRACIKAGMVLENLAGVLSATMPLTPELARAVEASWQAPVHDVYG